MTSLVTVLLTLSAAASPAFALLPHSMYTADAPTGNYEPVSTSCSSALPASSAYMYDGPTQTASPSEGYSTESPAAGNGKYSYENVKNKDGTTGQKKKCVLKPAVDWDSDVRSLDQIIPNKNLDVFWTEDSEDAPGNDPNVAKRIAKASYEMKYKAVNLGSSARIKNVSCKPKDDKEDNMFIVFQDKGAFDCAKNHWQEARMAKDEELLLGGFYEGCGGKSYKDGERTWSLVNDLIFDDATMTITCDVKNVALNDCIEKGNIKFGSYEPFDKSEQAAMPAYDYGEWGASFDSDLDAMMPSHVVKDPYAAMITAAPQFDKRWSWNPIENIKSAVQKVTSFVKKEVAVATSIIKKLDPLGPHTIGLPSINPSITLGPGKDDTLWGEKGNYIGDFENIQIWCVGCRFHGKMKFGGNVKFAIPDLIKGKIDGQIDFSGSLDLQLALGMYADMPPNVKIPIELASKNIFTQGIPAITIPGVLAIGPYVSLDANIVAGLMFNGRFMTGFRINYPSVEAHANLGDGSKSYAKGFDNHNIGPILKVDGNITASLTFGLPLSINFGISILGGKFEFSAKVIQNPSVQLSASTELKIDQDENGKFNQTSLGGSGTCSGVNLGVSIQIDWLLNLFNFFAMNLYHIPIWKKNVCWTGGLFINHEENGTGLKLGTLEKMESNKWDGEALIQKRGGLGDGPKAYRKWKRGGFDLESMPDYEIVKRIPDRVTSIMERRRMRRNPQEVAAAADSSLAQYKSRIVRLVSADGQYVMASKKSGNSIYAVAAAEQGSADNIAEWLSYDNVITSDKSGRALYVHRNELNQLGVGRLRLAKVVNGGVSVPQDAENVSLLAAPGVFPETIIGASFVDGMEKPCSILFPMLCLYKDDKQPPKMFVVKDVVEGTKVLTAPGQRNKLTGGVVDTCMLMQFGTAAV